MSAPTAPIATATPGKTAGTTPAWYARPRVVLSLLGVVVLATALFAREPLSGRGGDQRLSAYSAQPLGARLLYELATRLGWNTRRTRANPLPAPPSTVLAVLDPVQTITPTEAHAMLEHVRQGGGLLLALGERTDALADSLALTSGASGFVDLRTAKDPSCLTVTRSSPLRIVQRTGLWLGSASLRSLDGRGLAVPNSDTLLLVRTSTRSAARRGGLRFAPALVALPYGRGRIVVAADPDVFRNDAIRECGYDIDLPVVRALEYLRAGASSTRETLAFDEYHQGGFARAGMGGAVRHYLGTTASGHAVLQLSLAGIVLLLALAPRLLVPHDERRLERRSPLEHVDALARAYQQVHANRTATIRLVRGLRRRVERRATTLRAAEGDERFLGRVADTTPALARDVEIVRNALGRTIDADAFHEVGTAIANIESTLTRSNRPS